MAASRHRNGHLLGNAVLALAVVLAAAAGEPDPRQIARDVNRASQRVKEVWYQGRVFGLGSQESLPLNVTVRARARGGNTPLMRFDVRSGDDAEQPVSWTFIYDGVEYALMDHVQRTAERGFVRPDDRDLVRYHWRIWFMREFVIDHPFDDEVGSRQLRYEGRRRIAGVECHVIYVVYRTSGRRAEARWYFSVETNLPHRVERLSIDQAGHEGFRVLEIEQLNTEPHFDAETFGIRIPQAYSVRDLRNQSGAANRIEPYMLEKGALTPSFTLRKPDGVSVSLGDLRGRVVVLHCWNAWAQVARRSMSELQTLVETFHDEPVEFFAVSTFENEDTDPRDFMQENGYTTPILLSDDQFVHAYRVPGVPCDYVIDRDGKVALAVSGEDKRQELEEAIRTALGGSGDD